MEFKMETASRLPGAVPLDPIAGIVDAFRTSAIAAIADGTQHCDEQAHAFFRSLVADSRFRAIADDIVVEFGNSLYQSVMDSYLEGKPVAPEELQKIWQNTTQPHFAWDVPVYRQFFEAVRAANATSPGIRRLRVLLGDPPIDWAVVRSEQYLRDRISRRASYPADLIAREVLAKNRRALVIYGSGHLMRRAARLSDESNALPAESLVSRLERIGKTAIFTIIMLTDLHRLQADATFWPVPSMSLLRGTLLGAVDFTKCVALPQEQDQSSIGGNAARVGHLEDCFDAVIHAGPATSITISQLTPEQCADSAYIAMRFERMSIIDSPQQKQVVDQLKRYCSFLANRPVVKTDPQAARRCVGVYKLFGKAIVKVHQAGGRMFAQLPGQRPVEIFAQSELIYYAPAIEAQYTFIEDEQGGVSAVIFKQDNHSQLAPRLDAAQLESLTAWITRRVQDAMPAPGSESALRRHMIALTTGQPDYEAMNEELANATRDELALLQSTLLSKGSLQKMEFKGVGPSGEDIYEVFFEHGSITWYFSRDEHGKIDVDWISP
jgi:hypothetical protein